MIPSGIRLYSWVDVEDVLLYAREEGEWPDWLVWARAYWDGLAIAVKPGRRAQSLGWLAERFEPRFRNGAAAAIDLESLPGRDRMLAVEIEETEDLAGERRFIPTLARPSVLWGPADLPHPPPLAPELPPVVALHSFKGGVGRTLHALALAHALTRRGKETRVLLVDADLEAPGLTWLLQERFPQPAVSLVDLLALVHGDPDPSAQDSINLVADRVREIHLDGIFCLPAFRVPGQFSSIEVRPEHLVQGKDPFILTSVLAELGREVEADAVVVDLRAGLSELSAGLLLDPRVHRILVTTLSSQSLEGTSKVLQLLGEKAPSRAEEEPLPALILSQIPEAPLRPEQAVVEAERQLLGAARSFLPDENGSPTTEVIRIATPFDQRLQVLPGSWGEVIKRLEQSEIPQALTPLLDSLPLAIARPETSVTAAAGTEQPSEYREALKGFAGKLIYAERGESQEFLAISPLKNLASDFASRPPVAVVVGSKGAGKTYTFLQAVHRQSWGRFVQDIGGFTPVYEASLSPVLRSRNLGNTALEGVEGALQATARELGFSTPHRESDVLDYLRDSVRSNLHEGQWRERWLNAIAWRLGFEPGSEDAGARLPDFLRQSQKFVIAAIDGLEDVFQTLVTDAHEQVALRSLLQDVPDWLEQQPLRPIGLVVFVRRDMVLSAVKQNPAQLMARYEQYALKWGPDEALRLVAWTAAKARVLPGVDPEELSDAEKPRLIDELVPLWGRKLGGERSREAASADWVIAALSDLKGQIQARDLVRFLHEAAKASLGDSFWKDRILVPPAVRSAVGQCSKTKIEEISDENPVLKDILTKLRNLPETVRQIPFTREQVQLTVEELKSLEDNGAVLREGEEYYMPEIFRLGLGFKLPRGAHPRVMALARTRK